MSRSPDQRPVLRTPLTGTSHGRLAVLFSLFAVGLWCIAAGPASDFVGLHSDSAVYLLMMDRFSLHVPGSALLDYVQRVTQFPPLYPWLVAMAGGDSSRLGVVQVAQSVLLLAVLALTARLAWHMTASLVLALATLWCVATLPITLLLHSGVWSEFAYMACVTGALLWEPEHDAPLRRYWACALLCGLATATRSAGVVLVAAFAVTLLLRAPRRAWPALLLAAGPMAAQALLHGSGGRAYVAQLLLRTPGTDGLLTNMLTNVAALWRGWLLQFSIAPGTGVTVACAPLWLLATIGLWQRCRPLAMDAIYVVAYAWVLLLWPFPEVMDRLLFPLTPLLLIYAMLGAATLGRRLLPQSAMWLALLPVALCLLTAVPVTVTMAQQLLQAPPSFRKWRASREWLQAPSTAAARADVNFKRTLITLMREAAQQVPPDQCIHATLPGEVMYYSRRVSFPAPAGNSGATLPACHYQLLLGDTSLEAGRRALWQPYEIVLTVSDAGQPAGQLIRFPELR